MSSEVPGVRILGLTVNHFSNSVFFLEAAIVILYALCTRFDPSYSVGDDECEGDCEFSNPWDVVFSYFLTLVSFAYLYVISCRYSTQSIGLTLLIVATVLQMAQLWDGFWHACHITRTTDKEGWDPIRLNFSGFLQASYIASTVIIGFGALVGRVSALQTLVFAFLATFFATANKQIREELQVADAGGSMYVHSFGATFGLFASYVLGGAADAVSAPKSKSTGAFSLIGALTMFVILPLFNYAEVALNIHENTEDDTDLWGPGEEEFVAGAAGARAFMNTFYAVSASVAVTFMASKAASGKINHTQVLASVLGAGAAVAAPGTSISNVFGALLIGCTVGVLNVLGSEHLSALVKKAGFADQANVLNTNLIPGFIGCISSAIAIGSVGVGDETEYFQWSESNLHGVIFDERSALTQGGYQVAYGVISIVFAAIAGAVTGFVLKLGIFDVASGNVDDSREWFGLEAEAPVVKAETA